MTLNILVFTIENDRQYDKQNPSYGNFLEYELTIYNNVCNTTDILKASLIGTIFFPLAMVIVRLIKQSYFHYLNREND